MKDKFPYYKSGYRVIKKNFYRSVGGVAGGTLGFIHGNVPGAIIGAKIGYSLGKIKDEYDSEKK